MKRGDAAPRLTRLNHLPRRPPPVSYAPTCVPIQAPIHSRSDCKYRPPPQPWSSPPEAHDYARVRSLKRSLDVRDPHRHTCYGLRTAATPAKLYLHGPSQMGGEPDAQQSQTQAGDIVRGERDDAGKRSAWQTNKARPSGLLRWARRCRRQAALHPSIPAHRRRRLANTLAYTSPSHSHSSMGAISFSASHDAFNPARGWGGTGEAHAESRYREASRHVQSFMAGLYGDIIWRCTSDIEDIQVHSRDEQVGHAHI